MYVCGISRRNSFNGGRNVKPEKKYNFSEKRQNGIFGQKIENFYGSQMMKQTPPLKSSREI